MTTRAINALLEIMHDDSETMSARRRVEAAEHLLDYECPEGVVVECKEFLTSVFEDADMHVDIRLDALKLARKFEAATSNHSRRPSGWRSPRGMAALRDFATSLETEFGDYGPTAEGLGRRPLFRHV
jgi:hypothetical protein